MLHVNVECTCDHCGKKQTGIGFPHDFNMYAFDMQEQLVNKFRFCIPTAWAFFETALYCADCLAKMRELINATPRKGEP